MLDTNILLAAFGTRGLCETVFAECLESHDIFLSNYILKEFSKYLTAKFKVLPTRAREITSFLRHIATFVDPAPVSPDSCRDPADLPILGTLIAANADCLVTGDQDLLTLKAFQKIPILSPREFYDRFC